MKYLKLIVLPLLTCLSFNAKAGGVMKGGVMDDLLPILLLIYVGIPVVIGSIAAVVSKTKKSLNFFLGFIITAFVLVMVSILLFNS